MKDLLIVTVHMAILAVVYCVPWIVARSRRHRNTGAIIATNLLLGWTAIGWIVALIWSLTANVASSEEASQTKRQKPRLPHPRPEEDWASI